MGYSWEGGRGMNVSWELVRGKELVLAGNSLEQGMLDVLTEPL